MQDHQGTIGQIQKFVGVGLHTGKLIEMTVHPAKAGHGIHFQRTDTQQDPIPAHIDFVSSTELNTTIGKGPQQVSTIEHLMAAFSGAGIDNALVQLNAPEVPILDGSSAPYMDRFLQVGVQKQHLLRPIFQASKKVEVRHKDQYMKIEPSDSTEFRISIDFPSEAIGYQILRYVPKPGSFMSLCEARTFCHQSDVEAMRSAGLALGGSFDNAIVVDEHKVLNSEGLRYSDEFVRHKLLDCIGDLHLLGSSLLGKISIHKGGHRLHIEFLREIIRQHSQPTSDFSLAAEATHE
ncbi:MAG: UDP-3-O-acyl-N-acetylglucosamine deacetylase [Oligoflexales bacterium]